MKTIIMITSLMLGTFAFAAGPNSKTSKVATPVEKSKALTATLDHPAPDFELKGHDSKTYKLSDFKGKLVVLEWFNHECPYVKKHYDAKASNMQNTQKKISELAKKQDQETVWLTIISSAPNQQGHISAETAAKLKADMKANMTAILFDPDGKVGQAYQAKTTPHMYVIDAKGNLKYMGGIDDKASANISSLKGAKNYVLEAVTSILANKPVANASTRPYGCSVKYL